MAEEPRYVAQRRSLVILSKGEWYETVLLFGGGSIFRGNVWSSASFGKHHLERRL